MASLEDHTWLRVVEAKRVVDKIVKAVQGCDDLIVNEIIKGGSMGQGTIVPGHFDVDLVVYSKSVDKDKVAKEGVRNYLDTLNNYFLSPDSHLNNYDKSGENNGNSLQFCYDEVDVDLLLSPYWETKEDLYEYLKTLNELDHRKFSCSASKWQVKFVKEQPDKIVHEYIKRAKAWRKETKEVKEVTKSYLIVLLVIKAYEDAKSSLAEGSLVTPILVQEKLIELVKNHDNLRVCWTTYYNDDTVKDFGHQSPYIIDPANPANNVYLSGVNSGNPKSSWDKFIANIDCLDLAVPLNTGPMEPRKRKSKHQRKSKHPNARKRRTTRNKRTLKAKREERIRKIKEQVQVTRFSSVLDDKLCTREQKEFVEAFPETHRYIQYMKAWRDVIWNEHNTQEGKPTSYLIALLVIKAYEISDHNESSIHKELLNLIFGRYKMRICWNYDIDGGQCNLKEEFVIDPTNLSNDLYVSGIKSPSRSYRHTWGCFRYFANKGIIIQ